MASASAPRQRAAREPLYDINPLTGISIEVFYADRTLETFGRGGAGWFWWPRPGGCSPDGSATGPFATSYAAYRNAMDREATFSGAGFWWDEPTHNVNMDTARTRRFPR